MRARWRRAAAARAAGRPLDAPPLPGAHALPAWLPACLPLSRTHARLPLHHHHHHPAAAAAQNPKVTADRAYNGHGTNFDGSAEPIYGTQFLPRKFKVAVTVPGDNSVDLLTNDIGVVVISDDVSGEVVGYDLLVGGGMGRTHRCACGARRAAKKLGLCGSRRGPTGAQAERERSAAARERACAAVCIGLGRCEAQRRSVSRTAA